MTHFQVRRIGTCPQSAPQWSRWEVQVETLRLFQTSLYEGPREREQPCVGREVCYPRTTGGSAQGGV